MIGKNKGGGLRQIRFEKELNHPPQNYLSGRVLVER